MIVLANKIQEAIKTNIPQIILNFTIKTKDKEIKASNSKIGIKILKKLKMPFFKTDFTQEKIIKPKAKIKIVSE